MFFVRSSASSRNKSRTTREKLNRIIRSIFVARCVTLCEDYFKINDTPQIILMRRYNLFITKHSTGHSYTCTISFYIFYCAFIIKYFLNEERILCITKNFFLLLVLNSISRLVPIDVCHDGECVPRLHRHPYDTIYLFAP